MNWSSSWRNMFMLSFISLIVCGLFEWKRISEGLFSYCIVDETQLSRGGWDLVNWFNPTTFRHMFQARIWITNVKCNCFFYVQWYNKMSDVFVRIVDIGEIIDHHCFIFLAIRISVWSWLLISLKNANDVICDFLSSILMRQCFVIVDNLNCEQKVELLPFLTTWGFPVLVDLTVFLNL